MLVRIIIDGNYGHYVNGVIVPKNKNSIPFELEDSKALRLISEGVAEAVNTGDISDDKAAKVPEATSDDKAAKVPEPTPDDKVVNVPAPNTNDTSGNIPGSETVPGHLDGGSLEEYNINELRKLAKDLGVSSKGTKKELIERISEVEVSAPEDDEEPPVLEAAAPEV